MTDEGEARHGLPLSNCDADEVPLIRAAPPPTFSPGGEKGS
jgi:hypothetical protein